MSEIKKGQVDFFRKYEAKYPGFILKMKQRTTDLRPPRFAQNPERLGNAEAFKVGGGHYFTPYGRRDRSLDKLYSTARAVLKSFGEDNPEVPNVAKES